MATAKLVLIYPRPQDESTFEQVYRDVHVPMVEQKLVGLNRFVATKIVATPQGQARTYRISEAHFSSMEKLRECLETDAYQEVIEQARSMSTGGPPIILFCEDENYLFW